jgi:hypothetical protein
MNAEIDLETARREMLLTEIPRFNSFEEVTVFLNGYMVKRYGLHSTYDINCGFCFIWAYLVWVLWDYADEIVFVTTRGHVGVKYQGKFYDSENLYGANEDAVFTQYYSPISISLFDMCWYWARGGIERFEFRKLISAFDPQLFEEVKKNPFVWDSPPMEYDQINELYSNLVPLQA